MFSFFKKKPKSGESTPPSSPYAEFAPRFLEPEPPLNRAPSIAPVDERAPVVPSPIVPLAATAPTAALRDPEASRPPLEPSGPLSALLLPAFHRSAERAEPVPEDGSSTELPAFTAAARAGWLNRLQTGLKRTGSGLANVFVGARIDDSLYEELESALLMADAGVKATEALLIDLKRRVRERGATDAQTVKGLLREAIADLLQPLERGLEVGRHMPTVMMVVGVNGAGKTTTIGKLARHLAESDCKVLLAAADTFRAAAREQLAVWADRNRVEIVSQEGGDPAAVSFDAVAAAKARGADVVIADTAGRLPTQIHLMDELKKIRRVLAKASEGAPHEVLLVVDGNTGQNALAQVKAFDEALDLTGLVVTKLDGTAKGGVLAAIALWARERRTTARPLAVYFIGIGERLEDLQPFDAKEYASALLG